MILTEELKKQIEAAKHPAEVRAAMEKAGIFLNDQKTKAITGKKKPPNYREAIFAR